MPVTISAATNRFYLSTAPSIPRIELKAVVAGAPAGSAPTYLWTFRLEYIDFIDVPGGRRRNVRTKVHPPMPTRTGPSVIVPITMLMCGRLSVSVEVKFGRQVLSAKRDDILIGGTNPSAAELRVAIPRALLRKMIRQESSGKQFSDPSGGGWSPTGINPNWSGDNLRGVGLGQLTNPPPADIDIWDWRTNARHLQERFNQKRASAATLHTRVMASARYAAEAKALADWQAAERLPKITPRLPALTADQQDLEGLRAYNGYGKQVAGEYLSYIHEFEPATRVLTSPTRKGPNGQPLRSPIVLATDAAGTVAWVQISGAERRRRSGGSAPGDPDYVANVLRQQD